MKKALGITGLVAALLLLTRKKKETKNQFDDVIFGQSVEDSARGDATTQEQAIAPSIFSGEDAIDPNSFGPENFQEADFLVDPLAAEIPPQNPLPSEDAPQISRIDIFSADLPNGNVEPPRSADEIKSDAPNLVIVENTLNLDPAKPLPLLVAIRKHREFGSVTLAFIDGEKNVQRKTLLRAMSDQQISYEEITPPFTSLTFGAVTNELEIDAALDEFGQDDDFFAEVDEQNILLVDETRTVLGFEIPV